MGSTSSPVDALASPAWLTVLLTSACTGGGWDCLPHQGFFGQVLQMLRSQDLAAANLVSRSWHTGLQQHLGKLVLHPFVSLPPAAASGLSGFSALTRLVFSYSHSRQETPLPDRKHEYERLATALSALRLHDLYITDMAACPSDCGALGSIRGLHTLTLFVKGAQPFEKDSALLPALSQITSVQALHTGGSRERDLGALQRMPHLTSLIIGVHPAADVSALKEVPGLTALRIRAASANQRRQLSTLFGPSLQHWTEPPGSQFSLDGILAAYCDCGGGGCAMCNVTWTSCYWQD